MSFINDSLFADGPWQALERSVARLMLYKKFQDVRLIGRSGDGGADILARKFGKRYVVQVKFRRSGAIRNEVIDEVLEAGRRYRAEIPIIASNKNFSTAIYERQAGLHSNGIKLQLWDGYKLKREWQSINEQINLKNKPRQYQIKPIENIVNHIKDRNERSGIIVMATGLGKTFVTASAISNLLFDSEANIKKILVLAHTNELVYQLEKSFWPFLSKHNTTAVWNGFEKGNIESSSFTFACVFSVINEVAKHGKLPIEYDIVVIDEAHHAGSSSYLKLISNLRAGRWDGPYLLGMSATPWRSDQINLDKIFAEKLCSIDIVQGMAKGYLANVDYRMHVDNINWKELSNIKSVSPRNLNRSLFIQEWDDAVIDKLHEAWSEIENPKGIVFCSRIDHAITIRDKINARGITNAGVIYSGSYNGKKMNQIDRSKMLCDFADGVMGIVCAVDIFNEGIDVPDVNILVFQRVTHSRRIFVQQLGRGLRISPNKSKVIVLDFVSDIRRFAAGLELKEKLDSKPRYLKLGNPIKFVNKTGVDHYAESFLKQWLQDVAAIQDAGEDEHILKFPPPLI